MWGGSLDSHKCGEDAFLLAELGYPEIGACSCLDAPCLAPITCNSLNHLFLVLSNGI